MRKKGGGIFALRSGILDGTLLCVVFSGTVPVSSLCAISKVRCSMGESVSAIHMTGLRPVTPGSLVLSCVVRAVLNGALR